MANILNCNLDTCICNYGGECMAAETVKGRCKYLSTLREKRENKSPCDLCRYNPPSSGDGKPCTICPAESRPLTET